MLNTEKVKYGPIPFRFKNMWILHPSFKEYKKMVEEVSERWLAEILFYEEASKCKEKID